MSQSAPTALDRYRAAKLALDTWDAYRKKYGRGAYSPSYGDGKLKLGMDARLSITENTHATPLEIAGFNEHLRAALKVAMSDHMDAYRLTLVAKVEATYKDALREAAALIEETPPA